MHISIIDDERILSEKIAKKVRNNGFSASSFLGYQDFMMNGDAKSSLYIIDLSLRDGSGIDIVEWLRKDKKSVAPIIMISGKGDLQNKVRGLNNGADDYMVKPFQPEELIARINAILRRPRKIDTKKVLKHKRIKFDIEHREIFLDGVQVFLTRTEQIILETLMESIGTVVSKEKIIANVWGSHKYADVSDNTLSAHISNMKKRLGIDFSIYTEYNNGYMLKA